MRRVCERFLALPVGALVLNPRPRRSGFHAVILGFLLFLISTRLKYDTACPSGATVLGVIKVHHFCLRGVVVVTCTTIAPRKWPWVRFGDKLGPMWPGSADVNALGLCSYSCSCSFNSRFQGSCQLPYSLTGLLTARRTPIPGKIVFAGESNLHWYWCWSIFKVRNETELKHLLTRTLSLARARTGLRCSQLIIRITRRFNYSCHYRGASLIVAVAMVAIGPSTILHQ